MKTQFILFSFFILISVATCDQRENAQFIYKFFRQKGWTPFAICGMLGNMHYDTQIDPEYESPKTKAIGLLQWEKNSFEKWAEEKGMNPKSIETQCERVQWELENNQRYIPTSTFKISFKEYSQSKKMSGYLAGIFYINYINADDRHIYARANHADYWLRELITENF